MSDGILHSTILSSHPNGHFYSPVCDPADLHARREQLWSPTPSECLGIDFNDANHRTVLKQWFPNYFPAYDYPEKGTQDNELTYFYTQNSQFSWLDSRAAFVILRALAPKRIIEVGSGYSSLLMADINQRFLGGTANIQCIEPYPRAFLQRKILGLSDVIVERVENIPLDTFTRLQSGDVLFIDSSHVAKTGSDVNYLFFEVLPRLQVGVVIHIHDIFLPAEYPVAWAIDENRSWNEQYLLRALLMFSSSFETLFGCNYAWHRHQPDLRSALNYSDNRAFGGASYWIRRVR